MKKILHLTVMALALAAFVTTSFAGNCGSCPADEGGKKDDKAKSEEGAAS